MREIDLKPSRWLGMLQLGMAALALISVALSALPAGVQWALVAAVLALAAQCLRGGGKRIRLRLGADGTLQHLDAQGLASEVEVLDDSFVSPLLVVLRYRAAGDRRVQALALLPDSGAADDLRRLRAALRWTRRTRSDTSSPGAG